MRAGIRTASARTVATLALGVFVVVGFAGGALAVTGSDTITTVAGTGRHSSNADNIPATSADLIDPRAVAVAADGSYFIAQMGRVRKVDSNGIITTAAVSPDVGFPSGLALDANGNLYIADTFEDRVQKRAPDGTVSTFAGTGDGGFSGDTGPATSAQLSEPWGVAVDADGNVFIADSGNDRIRKVDTGGTITTVAGDGGSGSDGDGGPATAAGVENPMGLAVDSEGRIYIGTAGRIRVVDTDGVISTVAGGGNCCTFEGPAMSVNLGSATSLALDEGGALYIARFGAHISKLEFGFVTTVAGKPNEFGFAGDGGPAEDAELEVATGVALDPQGRLYIADSHNNRIRRVADTVPPTLTLSHEADGQSGWNQHAPVALTIEATDGGSSGLSGAPSCSDSVNGAAAVPLAVTGSASPFAANVSGEGIHEIECEASDNHGNSSTDDETVKIDTRAPGITFFGAGVYTVDQTVAITCTASDPSPGSGLASDPCSTFSVGGPAYAFGLGLHPVPANDPLEVSDVAGWLGGVQASFTVIVTYASLCNLTGQFSSSEKVTKSLCKNLDTAAAAAAKGKTQAKAVALDAYRKEVAKETGKAFTSQEATVLTQLSQAL
jgi:sugar lactone lactonase YvrE